MSAPTVVKPPKRIANLYARAHADEKMSRADKAELESWSLKRVSPEQREALWRLSWALVLEPKGPKTPQVPLEAQRDILAKRLDTTQGVLDDALCNISDAMNAFRAVGAIAEELSDEGDAVRRAAFDAALTALSVHGERLLGVAMQKLDEAPTQNTVKPEDVKELEPEKDEATAEAGAA